MAQGEIRSTSTGQLPMPALSQEGRTDTDESGGSHHTGGREAGPAIGSNEHAGVLPSVQHAEELRGCEEVWA